MRPIEPKPMSKEIFEKVFSNFEVAEMIFGHLYILDLPKMLLVSKLVHNAFKVSKYSSQYALVLRYEPYAMQVVYRQLTLVVLHVLRPAQIHISVHDLLQAFLEWNCKCGNYGRYVVWDAEDTIPRKVCRDCFTWSERFWQLRAQGEFHPISFLDRKLGIGYRHIRCVWCPGRSPCAEFPYIFECLQHHIKTFHPEQFNDFMNGWRKLGPGFQEDWQRLGKSRPTNYSIQKKAKVAQDVKWASWAVCLQSKIPRVSTTKDIAAKRESALTQKIETILKQGAIFGIPSFDSKGDKRTGSVTTIAERFARKILGNALDEATKRLEGELDRKGIGFLLNYYKGAKVYGFFNDGDISPISDASSEPETDASVSV